MYLECPTTNFSAEPNTMKRDLNANSGDIYTGYVVRYVMADPNKTVLFSRPLSDTGMSSSFIKVFICVRMLFDHVKANMVIEVRQIQENHLMLRMFEHLRRS